MSGGRPTHECEVCPEMGTLYGPEGITFDLWFDRDLSSLEMLTVWSKYHHPD